MLLFPPLYRGTWTSIINPSAWSSEHLKFPAGMMSSDMTLSFAIGSESNIASYLDYAGRDLSGDICRFHDLLSVNVSIRSLCWTLTPLVDILITPELTHQTHSCFRSV